MFFLCFRFFFIDYFFFFFFNDTATTEIYTLSLHDALPINYAPADAALVWLPLPALVAFAAAHPLRPLVRGVFAFAATLALTVGLTAQSRGAAIALAGALLATVLIARDRGRLSLTLLAVVAPVAVIAPQIEIGRAHV